MQTFLPWIGGLAAILTSLSYIPQVRKAWPRGSTQDLSLKMLVALSSGLVLWVCYGLFQGDWTIVLANCVGTALAVTVLFCKLRDIASSAA
jgi:MtN3 and saliva related transmembrane protein